jgi:hypothetical protein
VSVLCTRFHEEYLTEVHHAEVILTILPRHVLVLFTSHTGARLGLQMFQRTLRGLKRMEKDDIADRCLSLRVEL